MSQLELLKKTLIVLDTHNIEYMLVGSFVLIISKLIWSKKSGYSEKQFHDVKGIVRVQRANLDYPYLEKKVKQLQLEELWERLKKEENLFG